MKESVDEAEECVVIKGEGHFWGLRVDEMARAVADFFANRLG